MRRLLSYLLGVPIALAGEIFAHQLAYVTIHAGHAHEHLEQTGHGYLGLLPVFLASVSGVLAVALFVDSMLLVRGRPVSQLPLSTFVAIGPVTFVVQEHVERWVEFGHFPWSASLEPTFVTGLLLQFPAALMGVCVATALTWPTRLIGLMVAVILSLWKHPPHTAISLDAPPCTPFYSSLETHEIEQQRGRAPPLRVSFVG